jgi:pimeloyl-ACP methyl ester carboxylesterase
VTNFNSTWTGMLPVDDTALAVTDTGGLGPCVIYLNGQFASQAYWRRVIADLGSEYRHITYDMRARGRSKRSAAAASFETHVRDIDAVLVARGVDRAIVVGWSYGAAVAVHWAGRNPDRAGPVAVSSPASAGRPWRRNAPCGTSAIFGPSVRLVPPAANGVVDAGWSGAVFSGRWHSRWAVVIAGIVRFARPLVRFAQRRGVVTPLLRCCCSVLSPVFAGCGPVLPFEGGGEGELRGVADLLGHSVQGRV